MLNSRVARVAQMGTISSRSRFTHYTCYMVSFSGSSSLLPLICKHFVSPLASNLFVGAAASKRSCLLLVALSDRTAINSPCCYFFLVALRVFFLSPSFQPLIYCLFISIKKIYRSSKKFLKNFENLNSKKVQSNISIILNFEITEYKFKLKYKLNIFIRYSRILCAR